MRGYLMLSKTIAFHAATSSVDLGNAGERLAIALFEDNGFSAKKQTDKYAGDIEVLDRETGLITKVEVKTARQSKSKRASWQFCLNKRGFTSCDYSDFCLLFLVMRGEVVAYLVPNKAVSGLSCLTISDPKKYHGKMAKYRIESGNFSFNSQLELLEMS